MKKLLLFMLLSSSLILRAQTPSIVWAHTFSSSSLDYVTLIRTCPNGDIIVYGNASGVCDFEPSYYYSYTAGGSAIGNFVARYTKDSTLIWAKKVNMPYVNCMAVDAQSNIYFGGFFSGTVDFDAGPAVYNLTALAGGQDGYVAKLNSTGNLAYVYAIGGTGSADEVQGISVDNHNRLLITGRLEGTADFDVGPGTANKTTPGAYGAFYAKYDVNFQYMDAVAFGPATSGTTHPMKVHFDSSNNYFITGDYTTTMDVDPGAGVFMITPSGGDIFIIKMDSTFNFIDAKSIGGGGAPETWDDSQSDHAGNIVITGRFYVPVDMDPGPGTFTLNTAGSNDIFVASYSMATLSFSNAFSIGNSAYNFATGIAIDSFNSVILGFGFSGTIDSDPGPGTVNVTTVAPSGDVFLGKYLQNGTRVWAFTYNTSASASLADLAIDNNDRIYLAGSHTGTVDFDPNAGSYSYSAPTFQSDGFLAKYIDCTPSSVTISDTICSGTSYFLSPSYITETGTYKRNYFSANGCDSIVTLQLYVQQVEQHICSDGNILVAETNASSLQWYNCTAATIIPGATNDTLTVSDLNLYSFISNINGCTDTSSCLSTANSWLVNVPALDWGYDFQTSYFPQTDHGMAISDNKDVITTGYFSNTIDVDVTSDSTFLTSDNTSMDLMMERLATNASFKWAFRAGSSGTGSNWERGYSIALDKNENIYLCGAFYDDFDINPGLGVTMLVATGSVNMYFAKFNPAGQLLFAKSVSGCEPFTMTLDHNGNIIIGGEYTGSVDINPGSGTVTLPTGGASLTNGFFAKYDPAGNYLSSFGWYSGSSYSNSVQSCTIDSKNNIIITGQFGGTVDFNPGAGIFNLTSTGSGFDDGFIAKYGPNLSFKWALKRGTAAPVEMGKSVVTDCSDNIFLAGNGGSWYVTKYDSAGVLQVNFPITGSNKYAGKLAVDDYGNVYASGWFSSNIDMGGGIVAPVSPGLSDIMVAKYNNNGVYQWHMKFASAGNDETRSIALDKDGDLYLTGYYQGTIDLDPSSGVYNLVSPGPSVMFIAKYGKSCPPINSSIINNTSYLTAVEDSVWYQWYDCTTGLPVSGATSQNFYPTVAGDYKVVIYRGTCTDTSLCSTVSTITTGIEETNAYLTIAPNPSNGYFSVTVQGQTPKSVCVYDLLGKELIRKANCGVVTQLDLSRYENGTYFVRIECPDKTINRKIIKQ